LFLAFRLRKQRNEFNEFKEVAQGGVLIFIFGVVNLSIWLLKIATEVSIPVKILARALLASAVMFCVTYMYFRCNLIPIYKHWTDDQVYVESFQNALTRPKSKSDITTNSKSAEMT